MNKFIKNLALLLFFILLTASCEKPITTPESIFDSSGHINPLVLKILDAQDIKYDGNDTQHINDVLQKEWKRQSGLERHQVKDGYAVMRDKLWPLFKELGVTDTVHPQSNRYDYVLVLGAIVKTMRMRVKELERLWPTFADPKPKIIFLTGQRPLFPEVEDKDELIHSSLARNGWQAPNKLPKNESEAAAFVWDQVVSLKALREQKVVYVSVPMITEKDGNLRRPSTADTVYAWVNMNPKVGRVLSISNQPHVMYQGATLFKILKETDWFKKGGTLETVGPAADSNANVSVILDAIMRWVYTMVN